MPFLLYAILGCYVLPLLLLACAWLRADRLQFVFSVLTVSAVLMVAYITSQRLRSSLFGNDYSDRLGATIIVNLLVALALAVYLGKKHRWLAAVAASILALDWFILLGLSSVV